MGVAGLSIWTKKKHMQFDKTEGALWARVGKGLGHQIFDRFERFEDAVDEVLAGFSGEERAALRGLLERMLEEGGDARALWEASGAGIAIKDKKSARMTIEMLLQAVKARG
jgi:hypothetical protein